MIDPSQPTKPGGLRFPTRDELIGRISLAADPANALRSVSTAFTAALIAGGLGAFVGGFPSFPAAVTGFAVPVLATLAFGVWGWNAGFPKVPGVREKYADNCYYLGFLFNLIALIVGFVPAGFGGAIEAQHIMRTFGMALVTTAIGLGFRTVVLQQATDELETSAELEGELRKYVAAVSDSSREIVGDLDALRRHIAGSYEANAQGIADALKSRLSDEVGILRGEAEAAAVSLNGSLKEVQQAATQLNLGFVEGAGAVEALRVAGLASAENLNAVTEDLKISLVGLKSGLIEAVEALKGAGSGTSADVGEATAALRRSIDGLTTMFADVSTGVSDQMRTAATNVSLAAEGLASLDQLGARLGSATASIEQSLAESREALGALTAMAKSANQSFERTSALAEDLPRALGQRLQAVSDRAATDSAAVASGFAEEISKAQEGFAAIVREFNAELTKLRAELA